MHVVLTEDAFRRYVEEALNHLHDHFHLQFHPLGGVLVPDAPPESRGRALSRVLIAAIEQLQPDAATPPESPAWRKYHFLKHRYVEGMPVQQILPQLGLSQRQGRRDHRQALDVLTELLWEQQYLRRSTTPAHSQSITPETQEIEGELLRLANVAPRAASQVNEIVDGVLLTIRPLLRQEGHRFHVEISPGLPSVAVNPLILRQILIDLCTRAVDLSEHDEIALRATWAPRDDKLRVVISLVSPPVDSGVFDTSHRLAAIQGANLQVTHDKERSRLHLTLELPVVERATVLVIDDNPDVILLFRRYLGQEYRIIQATTADEAIESAETNHPSVITLDVLLPGTDGWQILEQLQRNPRTSTIPIIICSIMREPTLAAALGAAAFVPKPINPQALRSVLDRLVRPGG